MSWFVPFSVFRLCVFRGENTTKRLDDKTTVSDFSNFEWGLGLETFQQSCLWTFLRFFSLNFHKVNHNVSDFIFNFSKYRKFIVIISNGSTGKYFVKVLYFVCTIFGQLWIPGILEKGDPGPGARGPPPPRFEKNYGFFFGKFWLYNTHILWL